MRDVAAEGLLDSYHAERHPVGEEVVGRTVRAARSGVVAGDGGDLGTALAREAQLLVAYPDSPLVGEDVGNGSLDGGPAAGHRAPDATGLRQDAVSYPIRLHELWRHGGHTLLLWAGDSHAVEAQRRLCDQVGDELHGRVRCHLVVAAEVALADTAGPVLRDGSHRFAGAYGTTGTDLAAYVVRPDGYVGYRSDRPTAAAILDHLRRTLRW